MFTNLEPGWLMRQIQETAAEVATWPEWMRNESKIKPTESIPMNHYEVLPGSTANEAKSKSKYTVGELCRVVELVAIANGNETWSVTPIVEPIKPEPTLVAGLPV